MATITSINPSTVQRRILVFLWNEWIFQLSEPEFEEGGWDVGIYEGWFRQVSLLHVQLEGIHFVYVTRDSGGSEGYTMEGGGGRE